MNENGLRYGFEQSYADHGGIAQAGALIERIERLERSYDELVASIGSAQANLREARQDARAGKRRGAWAKG